jgi:hypothetical protein
MFARTAKVQTLERQNAVRAQVRQTFTKIQEPDRLSAALRRRRPVLMRRWQLDSVSGKPVCAWEVESPDQPPDLAPDPTSPALVPRSAMSSFIGSPLMPPSRGIEAQQEA